MKKIISIPSKQKINVPKYVMDRQIGKNTKLPKTYLADLKDFSETINGKFWYKFELITKIAENGEPLINNVGAIKDILSKIFSDPCLENYKNFVIPYLNIGDPEKKTIERLVNDQIEENYHPNPRCSIV